MGVLTMADVRRRKMQGVTIPVSTPSPATKDDVLHEYETQLRYLHSILPSNSWGGRRCWVVGGGPSLKDFDMSILKGELVIGINRAFEVCDPTILLAMDERFWGWVTTGKLGENTLTKYNAYDGVKCWAYFPTNSHLVPSDECFFLKNNPTLKPFHTNLADGLRWGSNTGYAAINLAFALGANPIYILGFDMTPTQDKKKVWWHNGYGDQDGQQGGVYTLFKEEWREAADAVAELHTDIVNLNPASSLNVFRKSTITAEKVKKHKYPIVVNFYTDKYSTIAHRMKASIQRFGFEVELTHVEKTGDWLHMVQHKPQFMLDKLLEHKRDILWLDADSIVNSYPHLFVNFKGDVGVHYIDWSTHSNNRRNQKELDSAVMYLSYNKRTITMLQDWVAATAATPHRVEQLTLQYMLESYKKKINVVNIPKEYCTIYDLMGDVEHPVIEQFQASRQFRD